jgi:cytochrome c oxidase assembly factor CtaG
MMPNPALLAQWVSTGISLILFGRLFLPWYMYCHTLQKFKWHIMHSIFFYWNFSAGNILFLSILSFLYLYIVSYRINKQSIYFFLAIFLIIICIASPIYFIGEYYLFSAHMFSHIVLLLIAAPLLVAAIPRENKFTKGFTAFSKKIYKAPLLSWTVGVTIMWLWHVPYLFNIMMPMQGMYHHSVMMNFVMHINTCSLLGAGILFCWPIINPYKEYRIGSLKAVLYLSTACVFCSLLGLLITFAPAGTYTGYVTSNGLGGFMSFIRNQLKISAAADQQIGGLMMWVPCCFIYLSASMIILIKWFQKEDRLGNIETNYPTYMN